MTYLMNQPFVLPLNCSRISANRCSVKLIFWYDRANYNVTFTGETLHDNNDCNNRHFIMIQTVTDKFFAYDIHHVCKETDDCARVFAEQKIIEMTQRLYNISIIYSDLQRLLHQKSILAENLACFDMNDDVRQCAVPGMPGSCQIADDLIKNKIHRRLCTHNAPESASINIYDSGSFATMTVKCNRMLCNGPLTITAVKKILQRHNISDINGRLLANGSQILLTRYIFILIISCCMMKMV